MDMRHDEEEIGTVKHIQGDCSKSIVTRSLSGHALQRNLVQ